MYNLRLEDISIYWYCFLESNQPKYIGLEVVLVRKKSCILTCLHIILKMLYQSSLEIVDQIDRAGKLQDRNQNQIRRFLYLDLWSLTLLNCMKLPSLLKLSRSFRLIPMNQMGSLKRFRLFKKLCHRCLTSKRIQISLCYLEIELG